MVLDPLVQLVHTLAKRIEDHRQALSQSEALTRYVLIDPLLRALGWDTEDPGQVQPESGASSGTPDYALMDVSGQQPEALIEAKKLGISPETGLDQIIRYWWTSSARYLATTNGKEWVVYDSKASGDRVVARFDIGDKDVVATAVKALFLWRGNYRAVVVPATAPPVSPPAPATSTAAPSPPPPPHENLEKFKPQPYSKPPTIVAPDGSALSIPYWAEFSERIVDWLYRKGKLSHACCPVKRPGSEHYFLVHTEPKDPGGSAFYRPKQVGPLWVCGDWSAADAIKNARFLLKSFGEDPALWEVRVQGE